MAYIPTQFDEQNQQNQQNNQQQLGSYLSGLGLQPTQQPQQRRSSPSGSFTNIQQIAQANLGSGRQLASRMGGIVSKDIGQVRSGIQNVQQAHQKTEESKEKFKTGAEQIRQAVSESRSGDVSKLQEMTSDDQLDRFYKIVQGETDLPELSQQFYQTAAQFGADLTRASTGLEQGLGTEFGRFGLTRRAVKSPIYTKGQQTLDQLIAQATGGDILKQTLGQERANILQSSQETARISEAQKNLAADYLNLANQTRKELQDFISQTEGLTKEEIEKREKEYLEKINQYESLARDILSGKTELNVISDWIKNLNLLQTPTAEGQELFPTLDQPLVPRGFELFKGASLEESEIPTYLKYDLQKAGIKDVNQLMQELQNYLITGNQYENKNQPKSILLEQLSKELLPNLEVQNFSDLVAQKLTPKEQQDFRNALSQYNKLSSSYYYTLDDYSRAQLQNLRNKIASYQQKIFSPDVTEKFSKNLENLLQQREKYGESSREYRQALVDKFLRENFGIDTSTRIYGSDLTQGINVDRSNLQERVRTQKETAQLNALRKLMAGKTAEQLSTEGIEQSVADVINQERQRQQIQKEIDKGLVDFLEKLKGSGTVVGEGKASTKELTGWKNTKATATLNPYEYFMSQNQDDLIKSIARLEPSEQDQLIRSGLGYLVGTSVAGPLGGAISGALNVGGALVDAITNIGASIGLWGDSSGDKALAQQRAKWDAINKYNQLLNQLQYNRRLQFK